MTSSINSLFNRNMFIVAFAAIFAAPIYYLFSQSIKKSEDSKRKFELLFMHLSISFLEGLMIFFVILFLGNILEAVYPIEEYIISGSSSIQINGGMFGILIAPFYILYGVLVSSKISSFIAVIIISFVLYLKDIFFDKSAQEYPVSDIDNNLT